MMWNDHHQLEGMHAFLGASQYHWINWNDTVFETRYYSQFSTQLGTVIHELASDCIKSRTKLTKHDKHLIDITLFKNGIPKSAYDSDTILDNLVSFVNDAIGFHMSSEVILFYNFDCFGTTDAIIFNEKERMLRIHDLKTGSTPAHMEQLMIYAALFCLEYKKKPENFTTELRIYQSGDIIGYIPEPREIEKYMEIIVTRTELIKKIKGRDAK